MADFNKAIGPLILREDSTGKGVITNDPKDLGGLTKYGISQAAFPNLDIANLTYQGACAIYKKFYWNRINGDLIVSQELAELIFDMAVNMGVNAASKIAQRAVGLYGSAQDGVIGEKTVVKLNSVSAPLGLCNRISLLRIGHYMAIIKSKPTQERFIKGWINRSLEFIA